jgi:predicted nucleic-acid-binding Zn-ribbon protein
LKNCPKCGGAMEKKGKGTDHNLRVEDRSLLRVRHESRLVSRSTRPLMYVCGRCGYVEFYVPTDVGRGMKRERKDGEGKKAGDGDEYYT